MYKGFHRIFWGFIMVSVQINMGGFTILPIFIGWLVVYQGLCILRDRFNCPALFYASILAIINAVIHFLTSLPFWNPEALPEKLSVLCFGISYIGSILFIFCILYGGIELLNHYGLTDWISFFERQIKFLVVAETAFSVFAVAITALNLSVVLPFVSFFAFLLTLSKLLAIRKLYIIAPKDTNFNQAMQ